MVSQTLTILDELIREKSTREKRGTDLLKDPTAETTDGWYMCVPSCFNESLDIKRTVRVKGKKKDLVWTQGSWFSFKRGDTVYDTPEAYKVWSDALKHIGLCVQIKTASNVGLSQGNSERFSGSVTFSIMTPDKNRSQILDRDEHTMSQDDFVRFLIAGPVGDLKTKIEKLRK
jgi:hypothetical protein